VNFTPLIFFAGIIAFWFLIMRPQRRARQVQAQLRRELKVGDEVMTVGGIFGVIREVGENHVMVEIATETNVRLAKSAVTARTEGEPEAAETPETSLP
jgi:preprotein translocase subunit YajC